MARVQLASIVSDVRGAMGGAVFKQTRAGLVLQSKYTGEKNKQRKGFDTRGHMQYYQRIWKTLSQAQRNAFIAIAQSFEQSNEFGKYYHLTGLQLFTRMHINKALLLPGNTDIISPTGWNPPRFIVSSLALTYPTAKTITIDDFGDTSLRYQAAFATPPLSPSIGAWTKQVRFIGSRSFTTMNGWPLNTPYNNKYGNPAAGLYLGFMMKLYSSDNFADSPGYYIGGIYQ